MDIYGNVTIVENDMSKLLNDSNIKIHSEVKNNSTHSIFNEYKFVFLTSETIGFPFISLEAIYCGCFPIILDHKTEYPWAVDLTIFVNAFEDLISKYERFLGLSDEYITEYRNTHLLSVQEKMKELCNIERIFNIFD